MPSSRFTGSVMKYPPLFPIIAWRNTFPPRLCTQASASTAAAFHSSVHMCPSVLMSGRSRAIIVSPHYGLVNMAPSSPLHFARARCQDHIDLLTLHAVTYEVLPLAKRIARQGPGGANE